MLVLTLPATEEFFNETTQEFVTYPEVTLRLEHSLASISKWESKHHKTWLSRTNTKTEEEIMDYICCMSLDEIDPTTPYRMTKDDMLKINEYINDPMTAVYFPEEKTTPSNEAQTSELLYYCMISNQIPFECQYWHLNKLLALIRVCSIKNRAGTKNGFDKRDIAARYAAINAQRRGKKR